MRRILCALSLMGIAGCAKLPYTTLPAVSEPLLIEDSGARQTYARVESNEDVLRFSVYTMEDNFEVFHRKWERHVNERFECILEKAYYMNEDDGMEVVLTDDGCDKAVDSVYLPLYGEYGRGVMTHSQRQQADEGMQKIKEDLQRVFDFDAEYERWRQQREAKSI